MSDRFDVFVIGAGPAGEVAVSELRQQGMRIALAERELVGGECAYWACMPSKTLLRLPEVRYQARRAPGAGESESNWSEIAEYRDYMIRNLDDTGEVESYRDDGVGVFKSAARIEAPRRVAVEGKTVEADRIVIATGSGPQIPKIEGLGDVDYWTNRQATTISQPPKDAIVLGGGPVGVELAQMMRRYGSGVTLVEPGKRLLSREDRRVSELLDASLRTDGINVRTGAEVVRIQKHGQRCVVTLDDASQVEAERLVVATGRSPRVEGLGLENAGIEAGEDGIDIDQRCRAGEGVWAVGDVTGVMPFTHVGKYQARIACADIGGAKVRADYSAIPRVVFCDPEVAAVGRTEQQARDDGIDVEVSHIVLREQIARPSIYEREARGELCLVADRRRQTLIGSWAVAPLAGEWIHFAALAIKAQIPLDTLRDSVPQFPTYSEAYQKGFAQFAPAGS